MSGTCTYGYKALKSPKHSINVSSFTLPLYLSFSIVFTDMYLIFGTICKQLLLGRPFFTLFNCQTLPNPSRLKYSSWEASPNPSPQLISLRYATFVPMHPSVIPLSQSLAIIRIYVPSSSLNCLLEGRGNITPLK